jgi:thioredoxin 1
VYDVLRSFIDRDSHRGGGWPVGHALKVDAASWEAQVAKADGLVLVDFWAVWCGPCQMVAPIIDELAVEYAGKVKVMKLNTDENPEIAGRYQVMSIPTILIFKNGQPVERLVGAMPKRKFKEVLDSLLAAASKPA